MKGIGHAAICILLVASLSVSTAQPNIAIGRISISNVEGGQVSINTTGNATGFATVTVNGRIKTIGATSTPGGTASNITDIDAVRGAPVMSDVETDPTTGVPAPPVMSPPSPSPVPGESAQEGAARLVNRVDVNGYATGTLQVFCEGAWGAVCTSNFDDRDAQVACRQLGFISGVGLPQQPVFRQISPEPEDLAPFALENLGCSGNESRLVDCPVFDPIQDVMPDSSDSDSSYNYYFRDYSNPSTCDPYRGTFARVACGTSDAASDGDVRLALGVAAADGSAAYGRLEVFSSNGWGTVCDNAFQNRFNRRPAFSEGSVGVACRQLGFQQGFQIQQLV